VTGNLPHPAVILREMTRRDPGAADPGRPGLRPEPDPTDTPPACAVSGVPLPSAAAEGLMLPPDPHLKVAFTTNSLTWVDADYSAARHLVFYDVTPRGAVFQNVVAFAPESDGTEPDESEDEPILATDGPGLKGRGGCAGGPGPGPLAADRLACLETAGLLFTTGLNDRAAMQIAGRGTFPVVVENRRVIDDVISRLQVMMRRDPPLWMCRLFHYAPRPADCPHPVDGPI